jgi:hypothetical protein
LTTEEALADMGPLETYFKYYYCEKAGIKFETYNETEYQKHGDLKHPNKPTYPNDATIKEYNLKPQGKEWEV